MKKFEIVIKKENVELVNTTVTDIELPSWVLTIIYKIRGVDVSIKVF